MDKPTETSLRELKAGDAVTRMANDIKMFTTNIHSVDDDFIYIGPPPDGWKFRRDNGAEVDEYLGWDGITKTGSYLIPGEIP